MNTLTYSNSLIYPDNSQITWKPNYYHEGYVNGKLVFRVIDYGGYSGIDHHRLMKYDTINEEWVFMGEIHHNATIYCEIHKTDSDKANKYSNYHSLHACQQQAENLMSKIN